MFDQIEMDEYRYNSGETVLDYNERVYGDEYDYYVAELMRIPDFLSEKIADVDGAPMARILLAIGDKDDTELGAAIRAVVETAAKEAMDDFMAGITPHETPDDLLKWWRS